jgi:hypothetical protein
LVNSQLGQNVPFLSTNNAYFSEKELFGGKTASAPPRPAGSARKTRDFVVTLMLQSQDQAKEIFHEQLPCAAFTSSFHEQLP